MNTGLTQSVPGESGQSRVIRLVRGDQEYPRV